MSGNTVDDAEHPAHDLGAAGEQEAQLEWETQYPLAHRLFGQYLIDQQGRTLRHPPGTATRAETAPLTTESDQALSNKPGYPAGPGAITLSVRSITVIVAHAHC